MTRKTLIQTGAALAALGAAGAVRLVDMQRKSQWAKQAGGHGGVDDAVGDTDARMTALPESQRLDYLLDLVRHGDVAARFSAIERLAERNEPIAIDAIADAYFDNFSRTRQRALENLPRLDPTRGIPLLFRGIRDHDLWLRETAAQQLLFLVRSKTYRPHKGMEAALVAGLHDPSAEVRTTSSNALIKVTGNRDPAFRLRMTTPPDAVPAMVRRWETYLETHGHLTHGDVLPPRAEPTRVDKCPDYAFQTIDGNPISRGSQFGRVTLLHFWGTWCGPCQTEMPELQAVAAALVGKADIFGLAMAEEKGVDHVRAWCDGRGITFRQSLDVTACAAAFNGIVEVPVSVLIDARGKVRYRWDGERDAATFRASIEHVLKTA